MENRRRSSWRSGCRTKTRRKLKRAALARRIPRISSRIIRRWLRKHQPVAVQIRDFKFCHPVFLEREWTRYSDSGKLRVLFIERIHIVRDDVDVPGVTL